MEYRWKIIYWNRTDEAQMKTFTTVLESRGETTERLRAEFTDFGDCSTYRAVKENRIQLLRGFRPYDKLEHARHTFFSGKS